MIPVSLQLRNFTSYGENTPKLDFTGFQLAVLSGRNGAGKSSLLDAITWCIWGTARAGDNSDKLVKQGQKEMAVTFEFELGGDIYKIFRSRALKSGGLTRLDFYVGEKNLTEGTIKATQEKIVKTLHLSYETFTNASFLRQGNADEFTIKGPTDRKRILAEILDLAKYDLLEERAKEKAKDSGIKIEALNFQIQEIISELSVKSTQEADLSQIEKELHEIETKEKEAGSALKEVQARRELAAQKVAVLEKTKGRAQTLRDEIASLQRQHAQKQVSVKDFQTILAQEEIIQKNDALLQATKAQVKLLQTKQAELNSLNKTLSTVKDKLISENRASDEIANQQKQIKDLVTRINEEKEHLKGKRCPTCGQEVSSTASKDLIAKNDKLIAAERDQYRELNIQLVALNKAKQALEAQKADLEPKILTFSQDLSTLNQLQNQLDSLAKVETEKIKLAEAKGKIEAESKALSDLAEIIKTRGKTLEDDLKELSEYEARQQQLVQISAEYQAKEVILNGIRNQLGDTRTRHGAAQKLVERSKQLETLQETKVKDKEELAKKRVDFEELSLAFGKKGIQAMIIENAVPEIEEEANRLLTLLTDSRMRVEFATQKETKTGGTVETLDIIISDENGSRSYELYSGGEIFRVNLAIRLALSKLLTHRAGAKLQFLVIDEGFGTQDTEGRDRVVEAINMIKDDFAKILIVTHIEELKEAFPYQIVVNKAATGSTFEIVGG